MCSKFSKIFKKHTQLGTYRWIDEQKKRLIKEIVDSDLFGFLRLKSMTKKLLINFLAVLPDIATTACSKDNIKHGFI
jgi:hypothetical protein